jgi:hypothetical protein
MIFWLDSILTTEYHGVFTKFHCQKLRVTPINFVELRGEKEIPEITEIRNPIFNQFV